MPINHTIPLQYGFALDAKNYVQRLIRYAGTSVLYYQFVTADNHDLISVIPDGCADFQFRCTTDAPSTRLYGSVLRHTVISYQKGETYFGVRFSPTASRRLAKNFHSYKNVLPYKDLIGRSVDFASARIPTQFLLERLCTVSTFAERVLIVQSWLGELGVFESAEADTVDFCLNQIHQQQGNVRVEMLAKYIGISDRTLRHRFHEAIGISPKRYSRIVRFQAEIEKLLETKKYRVHPRQVLTKLNYYDDSHLTKDFQEFTQLTPGCLGEKLRASTAPLRI